MNLKLEFNEVEINNLHLRTEFLINRLLPKDIKILLLTCYYNDNGKDKLQLRKELKIIDYKNTSNLEKDTVVDLYCGSITRKYNLKIGTGKIIKKISDKEIIVKPEKLFINNNISTENIEDMFKELDSVIIDDKYLKENYEEKLNKYNDKYNEYKQNIKSIEEKRKYINGLFKYYYDSLFQLFTDFNNYNSVGKITAISSYIIAKKYFKDKDKNINVSNPNVFIRNFNMEFDMLLLKSGVKNNNFVYDANDVEAIVELKSNGIIGYSKVDNETRWFNSYIKFDNYYAKKHEELYKSNSNLHENYENTKNKVNKIRYIYFCFYETNTKSTATYENTYFDIMFAGDNYNGIYLTITDNKDTYTIPIDYDINNIDI